MRREGSRGWAGERMGCEAAGFTPNAASSARVRHRRGAWAASREGLPHCCKFLQHFDLETNTVGGWLAVGVQVNEGVPSPIFCGDRLVRWAPNATCAASDLRGALLLLGSPSGAAKLPLDDPLGSPVALELSGESDHGSPVLAIVRQQAADVFALARGRCVQDPPLSETDSLPQRYLKAAVRARHPGQWSRPCSAHQCCCAATASPPLCIRPGAFPLKSQVHPHLGLRGSGASLHRPAATAGAAAGLGGQRRRCVAGGHPRRAAHLDLLLRRWRRRRRPCP